MASQLPGTPPALPPKQMSAPSDDELVGRCRTELPYDTRAYETLVRRYETRVYRTCRRFLGEVHDAEEVTQDVFLAVYWTIGSFRSECTFSTWLYRIARNKCISRRRTVDREERRHTEYAARVAGDVATRETSPPDVPGSVAETFQRLAPTDRRILHLRHVEHLSLRQLARVCGVSLSAAKMRLYRAEQRFRERYLSSQAALPM